MTAVTTDLDQLCINTIRTLAIDGVQTGNSGHPGAPMGAAPMAYVAVDPVPTPRPDPPRLARPRPLRAVGRARLMLLYSLLHLTGYDLPLDELSGSGSGARRRPATPNTA